MSDPVIAARVEWMRGRPEVELEDYGEGECWGCRVTGGIQYRYTAGSDDYFSHGPYPSPWYHECGFTADKPGVL